MTLVLFWDIDGTLLTTERAGVFALEEACREVLQRELDLQTMETRGLPDTEIAARLLERAGQACDNESVERFLRVYERQLPSRLHLRKGRALPGVVPILERLRARDDVLSLLLTGNTRAGAEAKLSHYGLQRFFDLGSFAEGTRDRLQIARNALALAEGRLGAPVSKQHRFVIGDTPLDVACAGVIEARAVIVATGGYSLEELRGCAPWALLPSLPEPHEFERLLGLA